VTPWRNLRFPCAGHFGRPLTVRCFTYRITYANKVGILRGAAIAVTSKDVISLTQARSRLSEIADEVKTGAEKIITKNGESYVALVDAERLDYYHRLERERIHLLLLEEAGKGLADIAEGRVKDARKVIRRLRRISESA
jgi:prevent-host-death family protein